MVLTGENPKICICFIYAIWCQKDGISYVDFAGAA